MSSSCGAEVHRGSRLSLAPRPVRRPDRLARTCGVPELGPGSL